MPRMSLRPEVALSVLLDAIMARNDRTKDPGPVVEELRAAAGDRVDILHEAVGTWCGFEEVLFGARYTVVLREALVAAFPECVPWLDLGRERGMRPVHTSRGF